MKTNTHTVVYVDASRDDYVAGLGYTITSDKTISGSKYLEGHYTSMEAEFHALVEAVRIASQQCENREYCEVYTDCEPLVRKICGGKETRADWEQYRQSAHWLLNKFDSWNVNHTSRERNEDAHNLAREALFEGRSHSG
jgi:ribonuclease HI